MLPLGHLRSHHSLTVRRGCDAACSNAIRNTERQLATYCSPVSQYAWPHYDRDPIPGALTAVDLLAPSLLSYPINAIYLRKLLRQQPSPDAYERLRVALEVVIAETDEAATTFIASIGQRSQAHRNRVGDRWSLRCRWYRSAGPDVSRSHQILHRSRPDLVPIIDSRLRAFYGVTGEGYDGSSSTSTMT